METRGSIVGSPAFNQRPMVEAAAGLVLGIALSRFLTGTSALIAACLFAFIGVLGIFLHRRRAALFSLCSGFGALRMIPYIIRSGGVLTSEAVRSLSGEGITVPPLIAGLSQKIYDLSDAIFSEASPLVRAILLGDRTALPYFTQSAFREAGAAHILALSGLHVGVMAAVLLAVIPRRRPVARLALTALFLALYCALAAFPSSLMRASVMTLSMLIAPVALRKNDPLSSLSLALIVVLAALPMRLFSAGLLLSFSAAAGILMLYSPLAEVLHSWPSFIAKPVSVTVTATAASLPFTLLFFNTLPVYSLVSNIVLIPLITFALPVALAALILGAIYFPLGASVGFSVRILLGAAEAAAKWFASLPYCTLRFSAPRYPALALYLAALILLSKYCLLPKKTRLIAAASLIAAAGLILIL